MVAKCSLWFVFLVIDIYISQVYILQIFSFLSNHFIMPFDQKKEGYLYGYWFNIKKKKVVMLQI